MSFEYRESGDAPAGGHGFHRTFPGFASGPLRRVVCLRS
jgi:hypothetical protein